MFGAAQLAWLRDALLYSHAPVKLIINGHQMWNRANRFEGWNRYAREQQAFREWLLAQRRRGAAVPVRRSPLHRAPEGRARGRV